MSILEILSLITFLIFIIFCLIIIKILTLLSGHSRYLRENYQKLNLDKFNYITFQQKW